ncbi:hypothetical protein CKY01_11915 [Photorhabdus laumondii subsp. clarkei]|uniref:Uncharacterized protein n=1 Tax=Photorhabdus laumondii subsp. clarkei TaxID=2029685 RepID=A0A329VEQ1_9GAMM|nr:hypothetical protein CKY01_11915 [Photorhabdus laumondii subsp. clarkei]
MFLNVFVLFSMFNLKASQLFLTIILIFRKLLSVMQNLLFEKIFLMWLILLNVLIQSHLLVF